MFGSSRSGGVRGGQDQFNWDDVKVDKHRENYLGESTGGQLALSPASSLASRLMARKKNNRDSYSICKSNHNNARHFVLPDSVPFVHQSRIAMVPGPQLLYN